MQKRRFKVIAFIPKPDGGEWSMRVGSGFGNKDDSINVFLDAIPTSGLFNSKGIKLQIRELTELDLQKIEASRSARVGQTTLPPAPALDNMF